MTAPLPLRIDYRFDGRLAVRFGTAAVPVPAPVPSSQGLLQAVALVQGVGAHSAAHILSKQPAVSVSGGHAPPPYAAGVVTLRRRDFVPEPHAAEQADHVLQLPTAQFTGHG